MMELCMGFYPIRNGEKFEWIIIVIIIITVTVIIIIIIFNFLFVNSSNSFLIEWIFLKSKLIQSKGIVKSALTE